MNFVSSRTKMKGFFEGDNIVLGPSMIGAGSLIGRNVIIGYPVKKSLLSFNFSSEFGIEKFDKISRGAKIGRNCIIRSGTVIYEDVTLGNWVETGHNVLVREGSSIGDKTRIGSSTQLDGAVTIGSNVSVQSNAYLPHLTVIEENAFLAPSVVLTNDRYPPSQRLAGIVIGKGAVIGANACIVAQAKIGEGAVVSAGAVVTKDVPPFAVVRGAPAGIYGTRQEYDKKRGEWGKK